MKFEILEEQEKKEEERTIFFSLKKLGDGILLEAVDKEGHRLHRGSILYLNPKTKTIIIQHAINPIIIENIAGTKNLKEMNE